MRRPSLLFFTAALLSFAQGAAIQMDGGVFRIKGVSDCAAFAVYVGEGVPPLLGSCSGGPEGLIFRPRYPLAPGIHVHAVYRPSTGAELNASFDIPRAAPAPVTTTVRNVYPSTGLIPENQLKFYVYFTGPMQAGEAWRHIHLLKQDGTPVDLPFLEVDQELWDRDHTRLTILFDPGRIKRGVLPLVEIGPAIEAGKDYTLVIDRDWLDARGAQLVSGFRKPFRAGPADRDPIDPARWRLTPPRAGTLDPLVLDFPESLDYALLQRLLTVDSVAGKVEVVREETEWRFTPQHPWRSGNYRIVIPTSLEDLAGNHVGRPFDVDTFDTITQRVESPTVTLPFEIR